jgi:hypothetical protein
MDVSFSTSIVYYRNSFSMDTTIYYKRNERSKYEMEVLVSTLLQFFIKHHILLALLQSKVFTNAMSPLVQSNWQ